MSSIVSALTFETKNNLISTNISQPTITVVYNETVNITHYSFTRGLSSYYINYTTNDKKTFYFIPQKGLTKGIYNLSITANDLIGNSRVVIQPIEMNPPYMKIWVLSPVFGVSNTAPFNAIIQSEEDASCRFAFVNNKWPNFKNYNFLFNPEINKQHTIQNVTNNPITLPTRSTDEGGWQRTIYLACNDTYGGLHPANITLEYDPSPSSISPLLTPSIINDVEKPFAILNVSTNDRTVCIYKENGVSKNFDGYNNSNYNAYKKQHSQILDFSSLAAKPIPELFQSHTFDYEISCTNLAGLQTTASNITLTVAFEESFNIQMIKPKNTTNADPISFIIKTSVETPGLCKYAQGTDNKFDKSFDSNIGNGNQVYLVNLANLGEGYYDYEVMCTSSYDTKEKNFSFMVDRTKPENATLSVNNPTCSLSSVQGLVHADDNYGIEGYNYSISDGTNIIANGHTTSGRISKAITLIENATYRLNAKAIDKAGNVIDAPVATFLAVKNTGVACDHTNPTTSLTVDQTIQGANLSVNCNDFGSGCNERFNYGLSNKSSTCTATLGHNLDEPVLLVENNYFCWTVFDLNNNNATGVKFVKYSQHCANNITDGDEIGVDCGGADCKKCEEIIPCTTDSDCTSKNCQNNICIAATCSDGILNQDEIETDCGGANCDNCSQVPDTCKNNFLDPSESDVDCGGLECNPCPTNSTCTDNFDCQSLNCENNICIDKINQTVDNKNETNNEKDSDDDGMPDYWEEKYTLNPLDPSDANEDLDNDGATNLEEYIAGTDPTDPNSQPLDSDADKMPDNWEDQNLLDKHDPSDANKDTDNDGATNLEEYIAGTDPNNPYDTPLETPPESKSSNLFAWILILLGLLMIIGSVLYLFVLKKNLVTKQDYSTTKEPTLKNDLSDIKEEENKNKLEIDSKNIFKKRVKQKEKERDTLVDEFSGDIEDTTPLKKSSKIHEEKHSEKVSKKNIEKSDKPKEDVFKELDNIGKEFSDEKEEVKNDAPIQEISPDKKSPDDVFKQLAQMTNKSHQEVKNVIKQDDVSSSDIMKIFEDAEIKDKTDMNVFKEILSILLSKGHLTKQIVAEVLFGFLDKGMLNRSEVSQILKELKLVK